MHQSAKDYLSSANALALSANLAKENKILTIRCFDYICSGVFQDGEIYITSDSYISSSGDGMPGIEDEHEEALVSGDITSNNKPDLLKYPVLFWMALGRLASSDIVDYFDRHQEFYRPDSKVREAWFHTY